MENRADRTASVAANARKSRSELRLGKKVGALVIEKNDVVVAVAVGTVEERNALRLGRSIGKRSKTREEFGIGGRRKDVVDGENEDVDVAIVEKREKFGRTIGEKNSARLGDDEIGSENLEGRGGRRRGEMLVANEIGETYFLEDEVRIVGIDSDGREVVSRDDVAEMRKDRIVVGSPEDLVAGAGEMLLELGELIVEILKAALAGTVETSRSLVGLEELGEIGRNRRSGNRRMESNLLFGNFKELGMILVGHKIRSEGCACLSLVISKG